MKLSMVWWVWQAHDEPPIWTLVCPSINAIFEEPVVASDGRSFSKKALRSLMASCKERGCPSRLNSGKRSPKLEPNVKMEAAVCKYKKVRAARMLAREVAPVLTAMLDGWQPPHVGEESSGKSSVLERLMMTPLLPCAENT